MLNHPRSFSIPAASGCVTLCNVALCNVASRCVTPHYATFLHMIPYYYIFYYSIMHTKTPTTVHYITLTLPPPLRLSYHSTLPCGFFLINLSLPKPISIYVSIPLSYSKSKSKPLSKHNSLSKSLSLSFLTLGLKNHSFLVISKHG